MNIELDFVLQRVATALVAFALCFQLLRHVWQARHPALAVSPRPAIRRLASRFLNSTLAVSQSRTASERLLALREGQNGTPPNKRIQDRVIAAISQALVIDESLVVPRASLIHDLHADSLNLIEMVMILEEEFGIRISDEDAEALRTVQHAIEYVIRALNTKQDRAR